ncbi:M48 family metalloprotease [Ancylobacter sp. 6x-1]|uniref:M48 family metalloprotease n=1 Tax=Ancylobacter crimeensis TaxID=2579147 RepID=A0ABT0D6A1_9HYPH|nr:M48 family metalloprotease [Ancylobacter crimeensis]MCK0195471.1 M48 family metalloprotease [Ancylobacter crimeensis]
MALPVDKPPAPRRSLFPRATALVAAVALGLETLLAPFTGPALAQESTPGSRPSIVRDAEIETLLRDYMRPIWKAAGLTQQNLQVVLVNDRSFNAFVADGRRIFVNTGALVQSQTPNEIIGVLAHETGHIAGGHLARMREQLQNAQTMAIVGMLLAGAGMAAAGAAGGNMGNLGGAAAAGMAAGPDMARRSLLAYQRSEEQSADRAAVTYLNATGQSPVGMMKTFERFANDQIFLSQRVDPYAFSHPMARERVAALEDLVAKSPYKDRKDPPALQARHDMMRAKLVGFTEGPDGVGRRYPLSDNSMPARYARAISAYRYGNINDAVRQIDALIATNPSNPYFYELKGQALLESGRAREAVPPLRKAAEMSSNALIRTMFGQALVASGDKSASEEAIRVLSVSLQQDDGTAAGWRYLAMAYGQKGDLANADLASAQSAAAEGDVRLARELAARAKQKFPLGSPGWLKADDIVNLKPPPQAIRKRPS